MKNNMKMLLKSLEEQVVLNNGLFDVISVVPRTGSTKNSEKRGKVFAKHPVLVYIDLLLWNHENEDNFVIPLPSKSVSIYRTPEEDIREIGKFTKKLEINHLIIDYWRELV